MTKKVPVHPSETPSPLEVLVYLVAAGIVVAYIVFIGPPKIVDKQTKRAEALNKKKWTRRMMDPSNEQRLEAIEEHLDLIEYQQDEILTNQTKILSRLSSLDLNLMLSQSRSEKSS